MEQNGKVLFTMDKSYLIAFHMAARDGLHEVLLSMLSKYSGSRDELLRSTSGDCRMPLHYAVERGHVECVRVLLEYGADPTAVSGHQPQPIHLACSRNKLDIVKVMVEKCGENVLQSCDQDGKTTLHSSITLKCCSSLISYLVDKGVGINEADSNGLTPLSNAIQHGTIQAVGKLLEHGGDPLIKDRHGYTALHTAVISERIEAFKKVVSSNAIEIMSKTADAQGYYPIHHALKLGLHDMVAILLTVTSDMFKDEDGNNYLHLAAASGKEETLLHLLGKPFAQCMLNEANTAGSTPLHCAAVSSKPNIVKILLNRGAIIHRDRNGRTPFMCACCTGNLAMVKLLYKGSEYQRDWVDHNRHTALHLAIDGKNAEVIAFCLDAGVDVTLNRNKISFFDKILAQKEKKLAKVVVSHKRWEECIDVHSPDAPHPILCILDQMPDVYQIILDQCHTKSSLDRTHPDYWEEFNFKCLDVSLENHLLHKSIPTSTDTIELTEFDQSYCKSFHGSDNAEMEGIKQQKKHAGSFTVLQKLVKHRLESYMLHPIVLEFMKMKWSRFGFLFQLTTIGIPFLLALLFSVNVVLVRQDFNALATSENVSANSSSNGYDSLTKTSQALLIISLLLALLSLLHFIFEVYVEGSKLLFFFTKSLYVWTNFIASSCIVIFLLSVLIVGLDMALWDSAAIGVLFAWFTVGLSLQFVQLMNIGVYITMMISTMKLVVIVTSSLIVFLLGFVFAFYIVLDPVESLQYDTIGLSLFSTLHSLIATTDFIGIVDVYRSGGLRYTVLVFLLLVLLIVMVPIVFINLLIGLAIGDIDRIQRDATFTRQSIEVRSLSSVDRKFIPHSWTRRFSKKHHRIFPNKPKLGVWFKRVFQEYFFTSDEFNDNEFSTLHDTMTEKFAESREFHSEFYDKFDRRIDQLTTDESSQINKLKQLENLIDTKFKHFEGLLESPK